MQSDVRSEDHRKSSAVSLHLRGRVVSSPRAATLVVLRRPGSPLLQSGQDLTLSWRVRWSQHRSNIYCQLIAELAAARSSMYCQHDLAEKTGPTTQHSTHSLWCVRPRLSLFITASPRPARADGCDGSARHTHLTARYPRARSGMKHSIHLECMSLMRPVVRTVKMPSKRGRATK